MTEPIVTVADSPGEPLRGYVSIAEYERAVWRRDAFMTCLREINDSLNRMVDKIEARQTQEWDQPTAPAPLDEKG